MAHRREALRGLGRTVAGPEEKMETLRRKRDASGRALLCGPTPSFSAFTAWKRVLLSESSSELFRGRGGAEEGSGRGRLLACCSCRAAVRRTGGRGLAAPVASVKLGPYSPLAGTLSPYGSPLPGTHTPRRCPASWNPDSPRSPRQSPRWLGPCPCFQPPDVWDPEPPSAPCWL